MTTPGKLIVLEGIDGSGTTSVSKALVQRLNKAGVDTVWQCEPTNGAIGKFIRTILGHQATLTVDPKSEAGACIMTLLFTADRIEHLAFIERTLAEGTWVVCDRYVVSTAVYQGLHLDTSVFRQLFTTAVVQRPHKGLRKPDLSFLLDLDVETAVVRRYWDKRRTVIEIYEDLRTQVDVAERYRDAFWSGGAEIWDGQEPVVVIDADRPFDQVLEAVFERTCTLLQVSAP